MHVRRLPEKQMQRSFTDYNGNPVLSAYTQLKLSDDITWAILSEIDEAEVLIPVYNLLVVTVVTAVVIAGVIGLVAFLMARSIANPLVYRIVHPGQTCRRGSYHEDRFYLGKMRRGR